MKIIENSSDEKKFYRSGITDAKQSASQAFDYVDDEVERGRAIEYSKKYFKTLREQWFKGAKDVWDGFEKSL